MQRASGSNKPTAAVDPCQVSRNRADHTPAGLPGHLATAVGALSNWIYAPSPPLLARMPSVFTREICSFVFDHLQEQSQPVQSLDPFVDSNAFALSGSVDVCIMYQVYGSKCLVAPKAE